MSDIPQGLIKGLILFNIFVNGMGDKTEWTYSEYVNDTKLGVRK